MENIKPNYEQKIEVYRKNLLQIIQKERLVIHKQ